MANQGLHGLRSLREAQRAARMYNGPLIISGY